MDRKKTVLVVLAAGVLSIGSAFSQDSSQSMKSEDSSQSMKAEDSVKGMKSSGSVTSAKSDGSRMSGKSDDSSKGAKVAQSSYDQTIAEWPSKSQEVAKQMVSKYGLPNEATSSMLIWNGNGPWKRSILHKEPVQHNFPKPHVDVLEQYVDMKVPTDKIDDIAAYDGSVVVWRTNGEVAARCDREEMNFLALNLAKDIAAGKKSTEQARQEYAKNVGDVMAGKAPVYTQKLQFSSAANTKDPGEAIMSEMKAE